MVLGRLLRTPRIALVCLGVLVLCLLGGAAGQSLSNVTDIAGSRLAEMILRNTVYASFNRVTFENTVASLLGIQPARVSVIYYYPFPILQLGTTRVGCRVQVFDGDGTTGYAELLRLSQFVTVNLTVVEAMTIFRTPAPPPPDDSSSSDQLGTGAIVAIIFGALLACAFCAILLACCVFALRMAKRFIDSKRHRSHDDFDDDSLDDSSEDSDASEDEPLTGKQGASGGRAAGPGIYPGVSDSSLEDLQSEVPLEGISDANDSDDSGSDDDKSGVHDSSLLPNEDDASSESSKASVSPVDSSPTKRRADGKKGSSPASVSASSSSKDSLSVSSEESK